MDKKTETEKEKSMTLDDIPFDAFFSGSKTEEEPTYENVSEYERPPDPKFYEMPPKVEFKEEPIPKDGELKSLYSSNPNTKKSATYFDSLPRYFFSGFLIRFFAFTVDMMIVGSLSTMVFSPLSVFLPLGEAGRKFISSAVCAIYFFSLTFFTNGQTLGKMIFGLRVIEADGKRLRLSTVVIREVFGRLAMISTLSVWLIYLPAIFTRKKQHFFDILCDTSVVVENYLFAVEDYGKGVL